MLYPAQEARANRPCVGTPIGAGFFLIATLARMHQRMTTMERAFLRFRLAFLMILLAAPA
jgi:hypothetical protein